MPGFRFRSSLKKGPARPNTCQPAANENEALRCTREKTSGTQGIMIDARDKKRRLSRL